MSSGSNIKEELYLVLGCFGNITDNFISCPSCENKILNLNSKLENYNGILDYLDTCNLFDKPSFNYNAIRHIIFNMQENFDQIASGRRLWTEKQTQLYHKFLVEHRNCGLYLKLDLQNIEIKKQEEEKEEPKIIEKSVKIVSASNTKNLVAAPKVNLKLIRGKR